MFKRLWEVIAGEAFRPDRVSERAAVAERFKGRSVAAFSFTKARVKSVVIRFDSKGRPTFSEPIFQIIGDDPGTVISFVQSTARKAKASEVMALVSHGWFADMMDSAYAGSDLDRNRLLREDAREVIGQAPIDGMKYAVVPHPTVNKSVRFSFQNEALVQALDPVTKSGITLTRVQSGCYSLLNYIANDRYHDAFSGSDLMIIDENGVLMILEADGDWPDLGSRSDASAGTPEEVVPQLLERRPDPTKPLTFVSTFGPEFEIRMKEMASQAREVKNLFPASMGKVSHVPEFLGLVFD